MKIWQRGDKVTEKDLNRYEQGLVDKLDKSVYEANRSTQTQLDNTQNSRLTSLEANKLDKSVYEADKQTQSQKDQAQDSAISKEVADRKQADATLQTNIDNKVTLNGDTSNPQNFNFIENKVVQDGLVLRETTIDTDTDFCFMGKVLLDGVTGSIVSMGSSSIGGLQLAMYATEGGSIRLNISDGSGYRVVKKWVNINGHMVGFAVLKIQDVVVVSLNGITEIFDISDMARYNAIPYINPLATAFVYNRPLTPKEIQHNFSVLNNSESINSVNVADKKLLLSSDTDHVVDRTGRTQEQINRRAYKSKCKEFTSTGGAITVNNAEEGYVLGATITGNTKLYKALKGTEEWEEIPSDEARDTVTYDYKLDSTQCILNNNGSTYPIYATEEDKANKKVIFLGSTATKKDTLELKEDGSAIYTQNTEDNTDGSARVDLATPIVTHIPKELIPTILTHDKINNFSVESAVAPSEFKVSVPVDRIGEIQAELDEIKAIIQAPSNMSLSMNYIDDEYTKNTNKESELI